MTRSCFPPALAILGALAVHAMGPASPAASAQSAGAADSTSIPAEPESGDGQVADTSRVIEDGVDYRVYDRWGNPTTLLAIVRSASGDDVLLVGEEHDDMVGHRVEVMLLERVLAEIGGAESGRSVVLSLEMFERDVQYILDEYLAGLIGEEHFLRSTRPWDDYETRYRALIETARDARIRVVAANAPRRYVSRVTRDGPASLMELSAEARRFLPPLPYPGPSERYREQWDAVMAEAMAGHEDEAGGGYAMSPNVIYAQALWDAAMGHAIAQALVRHLDGFVVHVAGSFHVERGTGILERIADYRPGTRVTTVVMTKVDDVGAWSAGDHGALADYVVLTKRPEEASPGTVNRAGRSGSGSSRSGRAAGRR